MGLLKKFLQLGASVLLFSLIGLILLLGAFLLPTERIWNNVEASMESLVNETDYYSLTGGVYGTTIDNYTEALYLNQALVGYKDGGLIESALSGYEFDSGKGFFPVENLNSVISDSENVSLVSSESRFFNGYLILIKPALMLMGYGVIRELNLYLCLFLTLGFFYLMKKRDLGIYIPAFLVSILLLRPITVCSCVSLFGFYCCMIVPCIVMLKMDKNKLEKNAWLIFNITGITSFYFNMNYFQLLCFAIPLAVYFLIMGINESPRLIIRKTLDYFVSWFAGFAGMMIMKWVYYAIFINPDIFTKVYESFVLRSGSDDYSRLYALTKNIKYAIGNIWWDLTELIFCILCILKYRKGHDNSGQKGPTFSEILLFFLFLFITVLRSLVLANHVIVHAFVTYRLWMIPLLMFNIVITRIVCRKNGFELS